MKTEDLQALGLDEAQIKKVFELNGTDIKAEQKKTAKAEADRDQWKAKAEVAEDTLKGFDGVDVEGLNQQIAEWKKKAEDAEKDYAAQIYERDFADTLKAELESVKFTSEAAKRSVMADIKAAGLKLNDGKILGLSDLLSQIKEKDASAFAPETDPPKFTDPPKEAPNPTGFDKLSLAEKMRYANEHPTSADVLKWLRK
jgi:hypothetical protein